MYKMSFLILQNINIPVSVHYLNVASLLGCFLPSLLLTVGQMLTVGQNSGTTVKRGKSYCHISDFRFLMFVYRNIWHLVAITMVIVFSSLIIEAHGGPRKSLVS